MHVFTDDHMVLQRGPASAAIYGTTGTPGETVTVSIAKGGNNGRNVGAPPASWSAKVANNGSWVVKLAPQKASTGWTVTVSTGAAAQKRTKVLKDVAFGDV